MIKTLRSGEADPEPGLDIEVIKGNLKKAVRHFRMPYAITAITLQNGGDENTQLVGVGLLDGAVIVIDLVLGFEKYFLQKHPAEVSALAFWEDKVLVSGSIDGRVHLHDLEDEDENRRMHKCANCQDRRIPVAKIMAADYGIGIVVDVEGNCRFYDLVRFKKMSKISSIN